ncbi:MAG TPA: SDR family oxidoreductase [candidate division Zixibacteria bacterium]|nr:SDR family oxidoreductase [candidate division Zixibacteria bacterium]
MSGDQTVVVTGASAGVGRALAQLYARRGDRVALLARGSDGLEGARRDVEALGGRPLVVPVDVADAEAVEAAAERVETELGPIDVWINNAMASVFSPIVEMTPDEFRRVTDVTYHGAVWGTLAALRRMRPRDRGTIVLVGSALAYRGIPGQAAYCAAKHAMQGFHDSLRTELMHEGSNVRVTMVQLPAVNTPQFRWVKSRFPNKAQPVPPIFQPEVIAEGIAWAADHPHATRELIIGWPALKAIMGNKLSPSFADRVLARTGYESQQGDESEDPTRPHNLWEPVDGPGGGDRGAHGPFDDRARDSSWQLWANTHRPTLALAAGAVAALVAGAVALRRG